MSYWVMRRPGSWFSESGVVLEGGALDGPRCVVQDGAQQLVLREVDDPVHLCAIRGGLSAVCATSPAVRLMPIASTIAPCAAPVIGVSTKLGRMSQTWMPRRSHSMFNASVKPRTKKLLAE
jgi:hypothetical protein